MRLYLMLYLTSIIYMVVYEDKGTSVHDYTDPSKISTLVKWLGNSLKEMADIAVQENDSLR